MILLQIPLPLSNIFMLCICVGTDIYPAISLAYEEPEVDIMSRRPRNSSERLVTIRMMTHSYALMGAIASAAGFYTYFIVMEVYGFTPNILINLISREAVLPLNSSL
jgi:sodium/potassium-transporting ATPase subunit alpha